MTLPKGPRNKLYRALCRAGACSDANRFKNKSFKQAYRTRNWHDLTWFWKYVVRSTSYWTDPSSRDTFFAARGAWGVAPSDVTDARRLVRRDIKEWAAKRGYRL